MNLYPSDKPWLIALTIGLCCLSFVAGAKLGHKEPQKVKIIILQTTKH